MQNKIINLCIANIFSSLYSSKARKTGFDDQGKCSTDKYYIKCKNTNVLYNVIPCRAVHHTWKNH